MSCGGGGGCRCCCSLRFRLSGTTALTHLPVVTNMFVVMTTNKNADTTIGNVDFVVRCSILMIDLGYGTEGNKDLLMRCLSVLLRQYTTNKKTSKCA